ncbi:Rv0361 family membrane protein [Actinocatenispora rupis]|uniref:Ig-like domain-containing protein n=1 Tax=Actinocatenispora rupis TaxID=519421 RepID=A0A8J3JBU2_9ACTN|nr:hypothetical protein [Actinocatenispora rupis]GID13884.1 hypothetical protein Aru02nite_47730 [Actinocatenispora rupis]
MATDVPPAPQFGYGTPHPPAPPRTRGGTVTVVVLIGVILLCLGLGTTGYLLVGRVPAGGASPAAAASGLLDAVFHEQNVDTANRYVCAQQRDANSVKQLITEAARYQGKGSGVTWTAPKQTSHDDDKAQVTSTLTLKRTVDGQSQSAHQTWTFQTVDEHGWRVCSIRTRS